jgi:DNA-binding transcriptional ArsR family regulator
VSREMTPALLTIVAERFRVLGEPARLRLLNELRAGEATVSALVERTGWSQANVSKHLQVLHTAGFIARERRGAFAAYSIASPEVFTLCDVVCGQIDRELAHTREVLGTR